MTRTALIAAIALLTACTTAPVPPTPAPDAAAPAPTLHPLAAGMLIPQPGDAGTVLASNGRTSIPTWQTPTVPYLDAGAIGAGVGGQLLATTDAGAVAWSVTPGTAGLPLVSNGSGLVPSYQAVGASALSPGSAGQVLWTPNGSAQTLWSYPAYRNAVTADLADPTGAADSSSAIQSCMTTAAASHQCCWLPPGTYKVASTITAPSNGCAIGSGIGLTTVTGSMTPSGTQSQAIFYANNTTGTSTTLNGNPTIGGNQITVTSGTGISNGTMLSISSVSLRAQIFTVTAGGGTTTLTLDRPLRDPTYATGGTVTIVPARPSRILLSNMTIGGTATRFIELVACYQCEGRNLYLDGSQMATPADILASFDIAGLQDTWRNVTANMASNTMTSGALALESNENSHFIDDTVLNASATSQSAFAVYDCLDCTADNVESGNSYVGFQITADGNTDGSLGTRISRSRFLKSTFAGVYQAAGSTNTVLDADTIKYVTDYGVLTDGTTSNLTVQGGEISNASGANALAYIGSGTTGTKFVGVLFNGSSSTSHGVQMAGSGDVQLVGDTWTGSIGTIFTVLASDAIEASDQRITATLGTGILAQSGGYLLGRGWDFAGAGGGLNLITLTGTSRADFDQDRFAVTGTANLFVAAAAGAYLTVAHTVATSSGGNALVTEPGTVVDGPGNDFTGYSARAFQSGGTMLSSLTTGTQWEQLVNNSAIYGLTSASTTTGVLCLGGYASASCSSTSPTLQGDNSGNTFLYAPNAAGALYLGAGAADWQINSSALLPQSFGGATLGTAANAVGATFIGGGSALNLGYTEFAAAGGTHNTQDAIVYNSVNSLRINLANYGTTNAQSYTISGAGHGMTLVCDGLGRVITPGSGGTCSFWAYADGGTSTGKVGSTYHCQETITAWYTGSTWVTYNSPIYGSCDCSGGACTPGSSPSNPLLILNGTSSGATFTLTWALYNDACSTPPVVDVVSACHIVDN